MPEDTPLYFAVLDGDRPSDWSPFGTKLPQLMQETKQSAKPKAVGKDLLETFDIYIEPVLKSPTDLLNQPHLDLLVGVIMDAVPRPDGTSDIETKLTTFHKHVLKMKNASTNNSNPLFRRIGYEMWFVTDGDSDKLAKYIVQAHTSAAMLKETTIAHYFFSRKEEFIDHTASYLSNVYLKMYRGM